MRESLKFAKQKFNKRQINAVELGVAAGENAQKIFDNLRCLNLFLIDSWSDAYNANAFDWLCATRKRFENHNNVWLIMQDALTAVNLFSNKSLDYIYLDDNHSPAHVYQELCLWFPKVAINGILAGHDWAGNGRVDTAVTKFCSEHDITCEHKRNEGEYVDDWWFVKNAG